jgi:hypothetical protein
MNNIETYQCRYSYVCTRPRIEVKVEVEAEAVVEMDKQINAKAKVKEEAAGALGVLMQYSRC